MCNKTLKRTVHPNMALLIHGCGPVINHFSWHSLGTNIDWDAITSDTRQIIIIIIRLQSMARCLPLTSFFQWQLRLLAPGTRPPLSWSRRLVGASLQPRKTQERRCSCSSDCQLLSKGVWMPSPSWLHLTPCDTRSWSLFLLTLIFMPCLKNNKK